MPQSRTFAQNKTIVKKRRNRQPARQPWGPMKRALARRMLHTVGF
jgi:hypothetical protein